MSRPLMTDVVEQKWPGVSCVVHGETDSWQMTQWKGPGPRPTRAAIEQTIVDYVLPKHVDPGTLMDRFTDEEMDALDELSDTNRRLKLLMKRMTASPQFNVKSLRLAPALAYIVSIAVPSVWPDAATANARLAEIFS